MSDLLQDIDDALKHEKAEKFWKENGPYILGGALLLVVMTGVFTVYNNWQLSRNAHQTALMVSAMEGSSPETALLAASENLKGKHRALALLQAAGFKAQAGKTAEALKLYQQVSADRSAPAIWRDLATLSAVRSEWGGGVDKVRAKALFDQVRPLTSKGNPWHLQAAIQAAMIAGDNLGDPKTALALLRDPLTDASAPPALKEKAKVLDHLYINASTRAKATGGEKAEPKG